ncbi:MAG: CHASE2 domain-containing protein [Calditrichaeota bacterium]|nr:CHASE2 domain-containing protein [Calditrichota bacterium]
MKREFLRRLVIGIGAGIVSAILVWIFTQWLFESFFYRFEAASYDLRLRYDWKLRMPDDPADFKPIEEVIIVDVDERSIQKLGKFHLWPRTYWAKALKFLQDSGVRLVGLDFLFDADIRHPDEDQMFIESIQELQKVVLAFFMAEADSEHFLYAMSSEPAGLDVDRFIVNVPPELKYRLLAGDRMDPQFVHLLNAATALGFVNIFPDEDGIFRRIPMFMRFNENVYPAFSVAMAMRLLNVRDVQYLENEQVVQLLAGDGRQVRIPVDQQGKFLIYYQGPFQTFRYIPFYDLLMGYVDPNYLKDKIVLVGSSAPGLFDLRATPLQSRFPGVEVNANVLYQILKGKFIREWQPTYKFLFYMLVGILVGFLVLLLRPLGGILASAFTVLLIFLGSFYALSSYSLWVPFIGPVLVVLFTYMLNYAYRYIVEEKDKRQIKRIFSHYLSSSVVEELLKDPDKIKLGGEKKVCTVMFSDLAGFTSLSEKMDPEDLVKVLNNYLTEMTNIIFENEGMLDKYEGDAIMAVFGAPVDIGNHAVKACRAALQMQRRLQEIREEWKKLGYPSLHQRIGINTGPMVVGNMGSETRFDYTVMGDSVNLGSRLEGANKMYGTQIMIGEETYKMARDHIVVRQLDLLRVKGKTEPVKVFELVALRKDPLDPHIKQLLEVFQKGYQHYLAQNWEWAMRYFKQALEIVPDDVPSKLYLQRCQEFKENPPGKDWDGVYTLRTK